MSDMESPTRKASGLNEAVAGEIRAELARRRWSQAELAAKLGADQMWLSRRLRAAKPLTLTEFDAIAQALEIAPAELLGRALRVGVQPTVTNVERPDRPPTKTVDHGPKGRPGSVSGYRRSRQKRALTAEERSLLVSAGSRHE